MAGMGYQVDDFELSMIRAAEKAAPAALTQMTFDDAREICLGGNTAATDHFKAKSSDKLAVRFRPIVESAMAETGVVEQYKQLTAGAASLPGNRPGL